MDSHAYSLLTTVLGALITGLFGIINTIITLRAKRVEKVVIERTNEGKSKPTEPISQKGRPRMLLLAVLIGVGAVIGFFIGNATKESPYIVKHYSQEEQRSISRERIAEMERQIHEIERERERIVEQSTLSEPERERRIHEIEQERERILEQPALPESERERRIHEIERERERILEQPTLPEPEREAMIQSYNKRIGQLTMEKAEFEAIARQVEIP